ncbi:hypothetical protein HYT74_04290 [Candidatus Daviesbacteria bacterium]|nr:hypothetical protein [Candidatus Daviesbacteria bacterium]
MNRNVSIVVVILVLVVIAGYLIWLRSKVAPAVSPRAEEQVQQVTATASADVVASASATPGVKGATGSAKPKSATPSSTKR